MAERTSKPEDKKTAVDKKPAATRKPATPSEARSESGARELPLVALRETVIFPEMIVPLQVGREKSVNALNAAVEAGGPIALVTQRTAEQEDVSPRPSCTVGTLARMLGRPGGRTALFVPSSRGRAACASTSSPGRAPTSRPPSRSSPTQRRRASRSRP
jgi:ATP-dependent Lon protease